jgi:hypothetical protein
MIEVADGHDVNQWYRDSQLAEGGIVPLAMELRSAMIAGSEVRSRRKRKALVRAGIGFRATTLAIYSKQDEFHHDDPLNVGADRTILMLEMPVDTPDAQDGAYFCQLRSELGHYPGILSATRGQTQDERDQTFANYHRSPLYFVWRESPHATDGGQLTYKVKTHGPDWLQPTEPGVWPMSIAWIVQQFPHHDFHDGSYGAVMSRMLDSELQAAIREEQAPSYVVAYERRLHEPNPDEPRGSEHRLPQGYRQVLASQAPSRVAAIMERALGRFPDSLK